MPTVNNHTVGPIGLGLMSFTAIPGSKPEDHHFEALKTAVNAGATLWNGAEWYGAEYNSMTLIKEYLKRYPEDASKITIIIKGGLNSQTRRSDQSPEFLRKSINNILTQLDGCKKLDIFGIARRDPTVDFAQTLEILQKEYVDTGKIGGIALSECAASTIHEAVKHVKVAALELELSLFSPDILHNGVAEAAGKYEIPIVAYSPHGRGLLVGRVKTLEEVKAKGPLAMFPRMQPGSFEHNMKLVDQIRAIAEKKGCPPAQLAIAWDRKQGELPGRSVIIPIPGASKPAQVEENCKAIELTEEEFKEINAVVEKFEVAGERYPEGIETNT